MQTLATFIRTDLVTVEAEESLADLESRLDRPVDYGMPVLGRDGDLRGVINPTDLLRLCIQRGSDARQHRAGDVCHRVRACLPRGASLRRAKRMLLTRDLDSLLVLDEKRNLVGILFRRDLESQGLLPERSVRWRRPMRLPARRRESLLGSTAANA